MGNLQIYSLNLLIQNFSHYIRIHLKWEALLKLNIQDSLKILGFRHKIQEPKQKFMHNLIRIKDLEITLSIQICLKAQINLMNF